VVHALSACVPGVRLGRNNGVETVLFEQTLILQDAQAARWCSCSSLHIMCGLLYSRITCMCAVWCISEGPLPWFPCGC